MPATTTTKTWHWWHPPSKKMRCNTITSTRQAQPFITTRLASIWQSNKVLTLSHSNTAYLAASAQWAKHCFTTNVTKCNKYPKHTKRNTQTAPPPPPLCKKKTTTPTALCCYSLTHLRQPARPGNLGLLYYFTPTTLVRQRLMPHKHSFPITYGCWECSTHRQLTSSVLVCCRLELIKQHLTWHCAFADNNQFYREITPSQI